MKIKNLLSVGAVGLGLYFLTTNLSTATPHTQPYQDFSEAVDTAVSQQLQHQEEDTFVSSGKVRTLSKTPTEYHTEKLVGKSGNTYYFAPATGSLRRPTNVSRTAGGGTTSTGILADGTRARIEVRKPSFYQGKTTGQTSSGGMTFGRDKDGKLRRLS